MFTVMWLKFTLKNICIHIRKKNTLLNPLCISHVYKQKCLQKKSYKALFKKNN